MLSFRTGSLQYQLSSHNAQKKMQKILDTHKISGNTYSATQQLSNSATQQLSNSASRLCPDKRAIFSFKQQHHYIFSSIFADGKRTVRLFYFKPQRALSMRRKIERRVDKDIPSKTLAFSASFAGTLRTKPFSG